jgi:hypothetical protein
MGINIRINTSQASNSHHGFSKKVMPGRLIGALVEPLQSVFIAPTHFIKTFQLS